MLSKFEVEILNEDIYEIKDKVEMISKDLISTDRVIPPEETFQDLRSVIGLLGCLGTRIDMAGTMLCE